MRGSAVVDQAECVGFNGRRCLSLGFLGAGGCLGNGGGAGALDFLFLFLEDDFDSAGAGTSTGLVGREAGAGTRGEEAGGNSVTCGEAAGGSSAIGARQRARWPWPWAPGRERTPSGWTWVAPRRDPEWRAWFRSEPGWSWWWWAAQWPGARVATGSAPDGREAGRIEPLDPRID